MLYAFQSSRKRLPVDWGFQQYEVVTDKAGFTWWTMDEIRVPSPSIQEEAGLKEGDGRNGSRGNDSVSSEVVDWAEEEAGFREVLLSRHKSRARVSSEAERNSSRMLSFLEKYTEIQVGGAEVQVGRAEVQVGGDRGTGRDGNC